MINLRPYQVDVKQKIFNAWCNHYKNVLLQMSTGSGKTKTFCSLIIDIISGLIVQIINNLGPNTPIAVMVQQTWATISAPQRAHIRAARQARWPICSLITWEMWRIETSMGILARQAGGFKIPASNPAGRAAPPHPLRTCRTPTTGLTQNIIPIQQRRGISFSTWATRAPSAKRAPATLPGP